ncbi:MAG TPA: toll/interleukin-1 receptor domain-containing protein, partial [Solirubrobacter sp.]
MSTAPYVFISYARQDVEFVSRLSHDLQRLGIETWRDLEQISPGSEWQRAIDDGIRQADGMLYVASAHSVGSSWTEYELASFFADDRLVIPIVLDDAGAEGLPAFLRAHQWVDFREGYDQALQQLAAAFPSRVRNDAPIEPRAETTKGYVFLSYADADAAFARGLREFLAGRGYAYWDYNESPRNYHTQLSDELETVIMEAAATLSILSPDWKRSRWAIKEFHFSEEVKVPV